MQKPQQRKKEESERLRGEGDKIKFIDLGFERWQAFFTFSVSYVRERPWRPMQSPNKGKKEESERLRGEGDKIKFIDLGFER